ncbi:MAG: maltose alpha-D-glucosyltransferase [Cellvibrio sp.]
MTASRENSFLHDRDWYKDAIIYQVHVKSFFDANNDGVGDFEGLIQKLDYIESLGVNTIWLLPFYPSPMRDDGYDIADYRAVEPSYGTLKDVKHFLAMAHKRGIRVITELVINHTSDQHPWFKKAREAKRNSAARNFYVWSDDDQKYQGTRIIFSDTESSNWTWDSKAGQYYWHRFYSHQPDLNFDNPAVLKEVLAIMRYWFELGVDGLRLDAIPYLVEREGTSNDNLPETHQIIKTIRSFIDEHYPDRMLLAEANLWPEDILQYFGDGDECHMAFHFPLMPRMYMAIAQEDRFPIVDILRQMPEIPECCQWAIFLRNHDELTLEMVTDRERDYLWNHYASDKRARINLGIRRRLAPLVERDRRRVELLNSLLLSMPGTPTLYYGDEIGMGDNIFLGDRHGVRTPMQWTDDRNGGFSRADPASLTAPVIMDPLYGFQVLNVEAQSRDTHSLLNWTRRILAIRKQQKAFGRGAFKILSPSNRHVLAYIREYIHDNEQPEIILCVVNLSRSAQAVQLNLMNYQGLLPIELIGGTAFPPIDSHEYQLTLPPYGFFWFLLADHVTVPDWYRPAPLALPELITLIIRKNLLELIENPEIKRTIEDVVFPQYLGQVSWLAANHEQIRRVHLKKIVPLDNYHERFILMEVDVVTDSGRSAQFIPLALVDDVVASPLSQRLGLSFVRRNRNLGILTDALTVPDFVKALIKQFKKPNPEATTGLEFILYDNIDVLDSINLNEIEITEVSHQNGSVVIQDKIRIKPFRTILEGLHPEVEITRFLEEAGYQNIVPIIGEVRASEVSSPSHSLGILQKLVIHQGNAWHWVLATLQKIFKEDQTQGSCSMDDEYPALKELYIFAELLGRRLGEMHQLLAEGNPADGFGVHNLTSEYLDHYLGEISSYLSELDEQLVNAISPRLKELRTNDNPQHLKAILKIAEAFNAGVLIRIHGDLTLANVLVSAEDAYFINFSERCFGAADASLPYASPFEDLAALICSFYDALSNCVDKVCLVDVVADGEKLDQLKLMIRAQFQERLTQSYLETITRAAINQPNARDVIRLACIRRRLCELRIQTHDTNQRTLSLKHLEQLIEVD